jgi:hypothetical protein
MIWRNPPNVVRKAQHDLRSSVPSRSNIFRHETLVSGRLGGASTGSEASSKTEIADLEFAIGINKQVTWLEIAVQNVCRVNVLQATKCLVQEGLEMRVGEGLS